MNPEALRLLADYNAVRDRVQAATDKRALLMQLSTRQLAGLALSVLPDVANARQLLLALQRTHAEHLTQSQRERLSDAIALLARCV